VKQYTQLGAAMIEVALAVRQQRKVSIARVNRKWRVIS